MHSHTHALHTTMPVARARARATNRMWSNPQQALIAPSFHVVTKIPAGPVLVDVPKDIQQQLAVPDWDEPMSISAYISRLAPPPEVSQLQQVLAALKGAQKPVIYYGGGCMDARDELREFAKKTGAPVTSTLMVCDI